MRSLSQTLLLPVAVMLCAFGARQLSAQIDVSDTNAPATIKDTNTAAVAPTNAPTTVTPTNRPAPRLKVRAGLRMELVAEGNLVQSPSALAFDERGRLFVAELRDYPASTAEDRLSGRVRLLEDGNGDGVFDTATVFADSLTQPTSLACSRNGVFISGPGGLLFALDQNQDGQSDRQRPLLTFQRSAATQQPDQFPRALTWGPNRHLNLVLPGRETEMFNPNFPDTPHWTIRHGGLSFNPLTFDLWEEANAGATGLTFDEAGHRLFCTPASALAAGMFSAMDLDRNPVAPVLPDAASLLSPPPGSAPLDCLVYRGHQYSTNLQGQAFLADPVNGVIYLMALAEGTLHPTVTRQQGQLLMPLVTSDDRSFRPMQMTVGPDDLIYIADLSREIYPGGKALDADAVSGDPKSLGRIWRLVPTAGTTTTRTPPELTDALRAATALGDSNSWVRATAARLLFERYQTNAATVLRGMLTRAKWPVARLEALRSLEACGSATPRDLTFAVDDQDPVIRATAAAMIQTRVRDGRLADPLWASLRKLSVDPSPAVRLQVALVLGSVDTPSPHFLLGHIYQQEPDEVWLQRALLTASPDNLAGLFLQLLRQPAVRNSSSGQELLRHLATSVALYGRNGDVADCLRAILDLDLGYDAAYPLIIAFGEGAEGRASQLPQEDADNGWRAIANTALTIAIGGNDAQLRAQALRVLGTCIGPEFVADEYLLLMFVPLLPEPMQIPVINALAAQGLDRDFQALTQRWHVWGPEAQFATLNALLEWDAGADALMGALADGRIPTDALTSVHLHLLRTCPRDDVRVRAERMFGTEQPGRDDVLSNFLGALDLAGSSGRGRELFTARCSFCHRADGRGLGPAPQAMADESPLQLLAGLLDPSRELAPGHATTVLRLRNGRTAWGIMEGMNAEVIHLRTESGARSYLRSAIASFGQTEWSLMPDNMAAGLTPQEVADLITYLRAAANNP